jgi:hypothetical protein
MPGFNDALELIQLRKKVKELEARLEKALKTLQDLTTSVEGYAEAGLIKHFCVAQDGCLSDVTDSAQNLLEEWGLE